jgi:hypothetical protein
MTDGFTHPTGHRGCSCGILFVMLVTWNSAEWALVRSRPLETA